MALVQSAHRRHESKPGSSRSFQGAAEFVVLGDAVGDLHGLASGIGMVEANVCCSLGKVPSRTSSTYAVAASPTILARLAYCLTKRCTLPRLRPSMSCQTRTCAS